MKKIIQSIPIVTGLLGALLSAKPVFAAESPDIGAVVAGNTRFACDLFARLKSGDGNLFFSPYSISTCLALTYAGARGNTEAQVAQVLHFSTDTTNFHAQNGELQRQLNSVQKSNQVQLSVANVLWGQKGHPFLPAFLDLAKQDYDANLKQVDFQTAAEPARTEINDWVSDRTSGRIKDLLAPGSVDSNTRLVLVNAIYFKGSWLTPFKRTATADAPFSVAPGKSVNAPFMHLIDRFYYAETDDLQVLELRYAGNNLSMVVLLPKATNGLPTIENALNQQKLVEWLAPRGYRALNRVEVTLPKFKMNSQFPLAKTLAAMGLTDAFSTRADFSGLDGARDLYVTGVFHKAFVEVNEEGTEAAAATGATFSMLSVQSGPVPVFRADHPFLFLIRDLNSGSILFLGRVTDPTK